MPYPGATYPSGGLFPGEGLPDAPETSILTGPPDSALTTATFIFVADPEEEATFEARVNGGGWISVTSPLTISGLPVGSNLVEIRAISGEGASDPSPAEWHWRVLGDHTLSPAGQALLDLLPRWTQGEPLYRGVCQVIGAERDRMVARAQEVRDSLIPSRLNPLSLEAWEAQVKLPRNPAGLSTAERWAAVSGRLRRIIEDPSGIGWVTRVTEQIGEGWTYEEEAPDIINVTVPWSPSSDRFLVAERVLLAEIPAAWKLILGSVEGFILDKSKLDKEQFHQD